MPTSTAAIVFPAVLLLLVLLTQKSQAFQCFTGDRDTMRRKMCPSFGELHFSDVCYKKIGEDVEDVQRGCFNSLIGSLITEEEESTSGCFKIPSKFGTGTICLCDTDLCNSSKGTSSSWTTSVLCLAGIIAWRWFT